MMRYIYSYFSVVVVLSIISVSVFARQPSMTQGQLENGLKYVLLHMPKEEGRLEVRLQVNVGASDENEGEQGVAHMVEHMVYRAAPNYPDGIGATLMENGWQRGKHFNAMTNYERTLYMFSPPKGVQQLQETLLALTAMLDKPDFREQDWQKEQQIILAEWRNGQGVNERMNRQRTAVIRSGSRQARYAVIGSMDSIQKAKVQTLQAFHQRWYQPSNMRLLLAGDFKNDVVLPLLEQTLGKLENRGLPERGIDYYEPKLQSGWHLAQLQDKDSGGSFVATIFRLDDTPSRDYETVAGARERLLDRYAAHILSQRIKNEQSRLPDGVSHIALRKADIGRHTVAIGLFASVVPNKHEQALKALLQLRQQLLDYPVTEQEVADYTKTMQQLVKSTADKEDIPEAFGDAIQKISDPFFAERPIRYPKEVAKMIQPLLAYITATEVQQRWQQWLNADDRLVQYQAPSLMPVKLATAEDIEQIVNQIAQSKMPKPLSKKEITEGEFMVKAKAGKIVSERYDEKHDVNYWQLSNGDYVIWLKDERAGRKTYLTSRVNVGYLGKGVNPWLSQLATQIVWQSAPMGWETEQLNSWKTKSKLSLNQTLKDNYWQISGHSENGKDLLVLYQAYALTPKVSDDYQEPIWQMIRQMAVQKQSSKGLREQAVIDLRYGKEAYIKPSQNELENIEPSDLLHQFHGLASLPAEHYLLTNASEQEVKTWVEHYLASIPRNKKSIENSHYVALGGEKMVHVAIGVEQRSDVQMWSWVEQAWQPEIAAQVSLLATIASQRLKEKLRDKELGVYSLKFESVLNEQEGRIESTLRFSCEPNRADELARLAEEVLRDLPNQLTATEVASQIAFLQKAEEQRAHSAETLLNRLLLSERHYGDARYLSEVKQLPKQVNLESMQAVARLLWSSQNQRVLVIDPKPTK